MSREKTVIDEIWDEYPSLTQTQVRSALARFLFRGEDVFKEIKSLSGGELARVELTKLLLKSVNFLIMDEPTNHLDIASDYVRLGEVTNEIEACKLELDSLFEEWETLQTAIDEMGFAE